MTVPTPVIPLADPLSLGDLQRRLIAGRAPVQGTVELSHRCNLRCRHCYVTRNGVPVIDPGGDLDTAAWLGIIDQLARAGCLYLMITGGEPMLRADFPAIYRKAVESGIIVTVFSNGTLLDDGLLDLFVELPPQGIDLTIYGASAPVHDGITGVPGSFDQTMGAARRLLARGIAVTFKTILMTLNEESLPAMEELARGLGVTFRLDPAIFPRLDGDPSPLTLRVPPERAVEQEFRDDRRARSWCTFWGANRDIPEEPALYTCGAARHSFHIDSRGILRPCILVREPGYDLKAGAFEEGWRDVLPRLAELVPDREYRCGTCDDRFLCGLCPAFFQLETGRQDRPSEYACRLGKLRRARIEALSR